MTKKNTTPEEDIYVSISYAAGKLNVYTSTVRRYFDRGILAGRKLPLGRRQILKRSLEGLVERIKQGETFEA